MSKSATDELRALLDAMGVEWMGTDYTEPTSGHATNTSLGHEYHDAVFAEYVDGTVLRLFDLTQEQAVEATLGSSNCTNSERMTEQNGPERSGEYVTVWMDHEPTKLHWGVPVVRCRDCKHYSDHEWVIATDVSDVCHFWADGVKVEPDGFCAWGRPKEEQ